MDAAKAPVKFCVDRKSFPVRIALALMALSAVCCALGSTGNWTDKQYLATRLVLPLLSAVLFIVLILLLGKKALWASCIPVFLGAVSFIFRVFSFGGWLRTVLCVLAVLLAAVLYMCTVFGLVRSHWLLPPLFAFALLYRIAEDLRLLPWKLPELCVPVGFSPWMRELAALLCLLSMLLLTAAMYRQKPETLPELPKIKDPVVIVPKPEDGEPIPPLPESDSSENVL